MERQEKDESQMIDEIKTRFGAVLECYHPDEDDLRFIEERDRLAKEMQFSFDLYVQHYELIKAYGLETKLINELEWFIVFTLEHNRDKFLDSSFYKKFKDHRVVKRAISEYKRRMEMRR
jgi:hypothetical protein